jgi:hypothetical protein
VAEEQNARAKQREDEEQYKGNPKRKPGEVVAAGTTQALPEEPMLMEKAQQSKQLIMKYTKSRCSRVEIPIPFALVSRLIGKGGQHIKRYQSTEGITRCSLDNNTSILCIQGQPTSVQEVATSIGSWLALSQ